MKRRLLWNPFPHVFLLSLIALQAPECMLVLIFTTDFTDKTDLCPVWGKEEIKKFVAFPGLAPLQPDAYGHPRKRASLSDPPHPTGLPIGRRKASKQNSCRRQYKISLRRRLRTVTSDLPGACHQSKVIVVAPGEPIFYGHRQLFCFLGA